MQIMKRARGLSDGEVLPTNISDGDMKEEVNYRNWKAGYTTKLGEPTYGTKVQGLVFWGKEKFNVWPRDKNGQLIDDD